MVLNINSVCNIHRYEKLVNQFEAVSYGSALFAAFLLLPTQQQQPVRLRMKLWCEHSVALRIISLNNHQVYQKLIPREEKILYFFHLSFMTFWIVQLLGPINYWMEPIETNDILLRKYAACLRSGLINEQRNPVLFQIASHHIEHTRPI